MDRRIKRHSTPVKGHETICIDPALSEIRRCKINGQSAGEVESVPVPKKRSKHQPNIRIQKNSYQKSDNEDRRSSDSSSDNLSLSSIQLFQSPSDKNYDNYEERYLKSLEDDTPSTFSDPVISSPVFQKRFRDETDFQTYSGPGIGKPRLSPSLISFSPKWENRIASKYNSPSDIPSRDSTLMSLNEYPDSPDWSSEASLPTTKRLWEDFVKETNSLSKSSTFIKKKRGISQLAGSKFSHLRVQNHQLKIFKSPTRKSVPYGDTENVFEGLVVAGMNMPKEQLGKYKSHNVDATLNKARDNVSKAKPLIFRNVPPNIQHSKLGAAKKVRSSPKYNAIDSVRRLGESSKKNNESTLNTDRSLLGIGSPLPMQSRSRIISIEVIKKAYLP